MFRPTDRQVDAGLAVIRAGAGAVFLAHGAQKLFVYGLGGVTGAFAGMGVPLPEVTGPLVAFVEFLGGIALILGVLTRLVGAALAVNMLGAIVLVHLAGGFFLPSGIEFALVLFAASLGLVLTGGGAFSVDALLTRRAESV